jgi:uncharacterized protein (TIGR02246 family)
MKEIESLFETYKNAVYRKDLEAFLSIYDDEVLVFDMWMDWSYDGLAAWRGMVTGWFGSLGTVKDVVTFEEIGIRTSGDLAVVTAYVRFAAVDPAGEELRHLYNRLTWVVRKRDGTWKIVHQHTSAPVEGETLKAILSRG